MDTVRDLRVCQGVAMRRVLYFIAFVILLPLVVALYLFKMSEQFIKYEMRLR